EHHLPSRSSRVRRRVRDRPAIRHRKSPPSRETEASNSDRNPAEEDPIPIHPLGSPRPPRSIQDKLLIALSESRKPRRNSARHPANAGLKVMGDMALMMERSPRTFAKLEEEEIRDHFLLQLNGHYEGSATGETFNAAGKTDILVREGNRNLFIGECKIWHGSNKFAEAIDQLLGYLTWRDTK